jgi:protease I
MKKVIFITAPDIFRDEEYFDPKQELENAGIKVVTASTITGELKGKLGATTLSTIKIDDISVDDFDAVVFIGGGGASVYFENATALSLAKSFFANGKVVASICIAGVILANAGILKGKKATAYISGKDDLIKGGASFTGAPVEIDGKIITANGPQAAKEFGKAIVAALN